MSRIPDSSWQLVDQASSNLAAIEWLRQTQAPLDREELEWFVRELEKAALLLRTAAIATDLHLRQQARGTFHEVA